MGGTTITTGIALLTLCTASMAAGPSTRPTVPYNGYGYRGAVEAQPVVAVTPPATVTPSQHQGMSTAGQRMSSPDVLHEINWAVANPEPDPAVNPDPDPGVLSKLPAGLNRNFLFPLYRNYNRPLSRNYNRGVNANYGNYGTNRGSNFVAPSRSTATDSPGNTYRPVAGNHMLPQR